MIEGRTVCLRAWREGDLPTLLALRNDVPLQAQLLARARGSDMAQVRHWLQERSAGQESLLWIVADKGTDEALGYVQVAGIDAIDRRGDLGICLAPTAQGRGRGRETIAALLPWLRDTRDLRKLSLRVRADNAAAIRCYERLGFEACGTLREHVFIDEAWQDVVLMDLFLRAAESDR